MSGVLLLASLAFAGKAEFDTAAAMAEESVGEPEFASAIGMAMSFCTPDVRDCLDRVLEIKDLDVRQKAYLKAHPPETVAKTATTSVAAPAKTESQTSVQPAVYYPPIMRLDQDTGLQNYASYSRPNAPWEGVQVTNFEVLGKFDKVCVMRDGAPIPLGETVPFAESSTQGTSAFSCPAANIHTGTVLYVPSGSTLMLANFDAYRQAYVVEHVRVANNTGSEPIQWRMITKTNKVR